MRRAAGARRRRPLGPRRPRGPSGALGPRRALGALGALSLLAAGAAHADDFVAFRGSYYREPSTRVVQPTAEVSKDVAGGSVSAHYLLDAITSASLAAGVTSDAAFTELRNEAGLAAERPFGPVRARLGYRYSSEPDYKAHLVSTGAELELRDRSTLLGATYGYGYDAVGRNLTGMILRQGTLQSHLAGLSLTQVLSRRLVAQVSYDLELLRGLQSNPYRFVVVGGGAPMREVHPDARTRHALAARLAFRSPENRATTQATYRLYADDWGILGQTAEARLYRDLPGSLRARLTYRYYTQSAAEFFQDGYAELPADGLFSGDPKLGAFDSHYAEVQLSWALEWVARLPLLGWVRDGTVELSYGYLVQRNRYGNAHVAQAGWVHPF